MGALIGDVLRVALGVGTQFHVLAWAYVTLIVCVVGPLLAQVAPRVVDPPARLLATRPQRVAAWLVLAPLTTFGVVVFLAVTVVGIPATALVPIAVIVIGMVGYVALARLAGERLLGSRLTASPALPAAATLVGLLVFRAVRLVPFIGAAAHSLIAAVGFAATMAVLWSRAIGWHRRRMPDVVQFEGETLVEWYPDGDPEGPPTPGTGRPVLGNVRGDEHRRASGDPADPRSPGDGRVP